MTTVGQSVFKGARCEVEENSEEGENPATRKCLLTRTGGELGRLVGLRG